MIQTVTAVFEKGLFRPLTGFKLPLAEGQHVQLIVETPSASTDILDLAIQVYAGLAEDEINEVEQLILKRQDFFGDRGLA